MAVAFSALMTAQGLSREGGSIVRAVRVGLVVLGVMGCDVGESDAREDLLLNGQETWERPEVGLISVGGTPWPRYSCCCCS